VKRASRDYFFSIAFTAIAFAVAATEPGGTTVTITGTGLGSIVQVYFGDQLATIVGEPTDESITVIVPQSTVGTGTVDITLVDNMDELFVIEDGYTYLPGTVELQLVTVPRRYRLISCPMLLDPADMVTAFEPSLGPQDPRDWRCFVVDHDETGRVVYREVRDANDADTVPGSGAWLITRDETVLSLSGQEVSPSGDYPIELDPGFNIVGTPFNFAVSIEDLVVEVPDGQGETVPFLDDQNIYTAPVLYAYPQDGPTDYVLATVLDPGEGYWLENLTGGPVTLLVPPMASSSKAYDIDYSDKVYVYIGDPPPPPPDERIEDDDGHVHGSVSCFIATAAYDGRDTGRIETLRRFRDDVLLKTPFGSFLVRMYYRWSPPPADLVARHPMMAASVRTVLGPVSALAGIAMLATRASGLPTHGIGSITLMVAVLLWLCYNVRRIVRERAENHDRATRN